MATALEQLLGIVQELKLDTALLALNHFLSVSRGLTDDPALKSRISELQFPPPPYIVHFLAKQIILHSSNFGRRSLNWNIFVDLMDDCLKLDDPIQHDPKWKESDPTGFFERTLSQQAPSQRFHPIQSHGLALGLYRDAGEIQWPYQYDLRADIEGELSMSIDSFLSMGHTCLAYQQAKYDRYPCWGTFTPMYLAEAFAQGIEVSVPEVWTPFLQRVACTPEKFRTINSQNPYKTQESHYQQFEWNPLYRFPILEVKSQHYIAVDPFLLVERTSLGLFRDLFDRDKSKFGSRFGYVFDQFVGQLLASACPNRLLWSASFWEMQQAEAGRQSNHGKICDWAFTGSACTVLLECKSLRPSIELTTYGSDKAVQQVNDRIASALEQLIEHSNAIDAGDWKSQGLLPNQVVCVVVTYGRIQTVNGPFTRKRVAQRLTDKGLNVPPYVVLSLEELDCVVRLVETGKPFDEVILALSKQDHSFDVLQLFHEELKDRAVSSFAFERANALIKNVVQERKPNV